jgi:hypothetical protein
MSKLETARQLAAQTTEQGPYIESNLPPQDRADEHGNHGLRTGSSEKLEPDAGKSAAINPPGISSHGIEENPGETVANGFDANRSTDNHDFNSANTLDIEISDDIDDEAILGMNRHKKGKARKNGR